MNLKKYLSSLLLTIVGFTSCSSDVVIENGNSLLWKVEGEKCKTSYIFGTMHMIDEEYFNMSENLVTKIKKSEAIIMEVGGMPDPITAMNLMLLDSGSVNDYFTAEQMVVLLDFMDKKLNTSPETFQLIYGKMKPFFILQSISQSYFSENAQSYDLNIMAIANNERIPLIGLETIEEQLEFFDLIPNEEMASLIIESIANFEKEKKETQKLMKIYFEQNVEKMIPMMKKQSPEFMKYEDIFLTGRNKKWIPKLKEEFSTKHCFVAVGAAHLFGDTGILNLLRNEGFTLTAISTN